MCELNTMDIAEMQECLEAYKILLNWVPATDSHDFQMKEGRLSIVNYLIDKCEHLIEKESKKHG